MRSLTMVSVVVLAALLAFGAGIASTEPAAISVQRAAVARLQDDLGRIDDRVEAAAEAYNGAVYEHGQIQGRIVQNTKDIQVTQTKLDRRRRILAERLREIYATPQPTLAEVLVNSGSLSEAVAQLDMMGQIGEQDARIVGDLKADRERLAALRVQLIADRADAARQVEARRRQKERVEELLAQRRAVLAGAKGRLGQLLAAERERQAAEAAHQAQLARERIASEQSNEARHGPAAPSPAGPASPTPATPGPAAPASPAAPPSSRPAPPAPASPSSPTPSPPAPPSPARAAPATPSTGSNAGAVRAAMSQLGTPYVWGGASPGGFDCSGLVSWAYARIGKSVPHYTGAIWNAFPHVSSGDLQPGDLVFFNGGEHVGMYIGGGQYVNAPHTGDVVKVQGMGARSDYLGAVRP